LAGWSGAIGPPVPVADAAKSLRWAEAAVRLMERRLLPAGEVLHCTEHTEALVLLQPEELIDDLAQRCLAPLTHCGPTHGPLLAGWSGAIGPPVPVADAAKSLRWAEAAVRLMERRLLPAGEVLHCTEHTEALVLLQPEELIDDLAQRCLAPLTHCGPTHGRRL